MLNRRNFMTAAAACLLTKKMPAWSRPKPEPLPLPLPVRYIWAPYHELDVQDMTAECNAFYERFGERGRKAFLNFWGNPEANPRLA